MIEYELYEDDDDVIRPRHVTKKAKPKKSDHKHDYKLVDSSKTVFFRKVEVCQICGREGKAFITREREDERDSE